MRWKIERNTQMATGDMDWERLVREYEAAKVALEAASAALVAHIVNDTPPQTAEILDRELARARLIAAGYALHGDEQRPREISN